MRQNLCTPRRRALRARRKITGFARARKAERHWHNSDPFRIVERLRCDPHPLAQTLTAGIIERDTGFVDSSTGRLAGNQHARPRIDLKNRANSVRQFRSAQRAGANFAKQSIDRTHRNDRFNAATAFTRDQPLSSRRVRAESNGDSGIHLRNSSPRRSCSGATAQPAVQYL